MLRSGDSVDINIFLLGCIRPALSIRNVDTRVSAKKDVYWPPQESFGICFIRQWRNGIKVARLEKHSTCPTKADPAIKIDRCCTIYPCFCDRARQKLLTTMQSTRHLHFWQALCRQWEYTWRKPANSDRVAIFKKQHKINGWCKADRIIWKKKSFFYRDNRDCRGCILYVLMHPARLCGETTLSNTVFVKSN